MNNYLPVIKNTSNTKARATLAEAVIEDQYVRYLSRKNSIAYLNRVEDGKSIHSWVWFGLFFNFGVSAGLMLHWGMLF